MSLRGAFKLPGDKSISHRIALLSLLARGSCKVENYSPSEDTATTLEALRGLGVEIHSNADGLLIRAIEGCVFRNVEIQCGNSGTTMRLLMGILAGLQGDFVLDGDLSLRNRPMERVASPLKQMGAEVECVEGKPPVRIRGKSLKGIDYALPIPSAQLKSAVLLAGIQAEGMTRVLEPLPSRDHTERLLALCETDISRIPGGWSVARSTPLMPETFCVPGDASSAAFFVCAAAIIPDSDVAAEGVLLNPTRTGFFEVLSRMGAMVEMETSERTPEPIGTIRSRFSPVLSGCEVHSHEIPLLVDEVPILALVATQARGTTIFHDVGELRVKESDRLEALTTQLGAMGARIRIEKDALLVEGPTPLHTPATLRSFWDHRIAMTLRIAALLTGSEPMIEGEECVAISYPDFHETLEALKR